MRSMPDPAVLADAHYRHIEEQYEAIRERSRCDFCANCNAPDDALQTGFEVARDAMRFISYETGGGMEHGERSRVENAIAVYAKWAVENTCWCAAHHEFVHGDDPVGDCTEFEPMEWPVEP